MNILITGATGFIGTHLSKLLVEQGHELTALLRTESKKHLLPKNAKILQGDLSIFEDEQLQLPPFDIVIHLAGVIFASSNQAYRKYNYLAVKSLIKCIQRQTWTPKRFLFASSLAAAGSSGTKDRILTEQDTAKPVDPYGSAKLEAEAYLSTIKDFPTTSFRPAIVLGPGDENSLTLFQMANKRFGMSVSGKPQYITFVDVADLNDAIVKMMQDTRTGHQKYFVAHPDTITNLSLFETLGKVLNKKVFVFPLPKPILYVAMQGSTLVSKLLGIKNQLDRKQYDQLINHFVCSSEALQKDLDWQPKYDLYASVEKAYEGYKELGIMS